MMGPPARAPVVVGSDRTNRRRGGATASRAVPASDQAPHQPACACAEADRPPAAEDVVGTLLAFVLAGSALLAAIVLLSTSLA